MKKRMCLLAMFLSIASIAQTEKITNILNKALEIEIKLQSQIHTEVDSLGNDIAYHQMVDTIVVVKPFEIIDNMLTLTTQHNLPYDDDYYIEKQVVYLDKITAINKDIGVLFETLSNDVTISTTTYHKDGSIIESAHRSDLLRTHCLSERNNEYLRDDLIKAFKKAGYKIESSYWYD